MYIAFRDILNTLAYLIYLIIYKKLQIYKGNDCVFKILFLDHWYFDRY